MSLPRVLTAVATPFDSYNNVDYESLIELVRYQINYNCGVVLFGTTGECPTISNNERNSIMMTLINTFESSKNLFVIGVGGNNTDECIYNINQAKTYGFNTFMLTTPYYNKPTQLGLEKHFTFICNKFSNDKFILYNVPGRTNVNLLPKTVLNIINECSNVVAIKEASGDLAQMTLIRRLCPNLNLYCGDDGLIIPAMSIGAYGIISVLSNYNPKIVNIITELCVKNNYNEAFNIYSQVDDIIRLLFSETSPSPIKYLLKFIGLIDYDDVRLPLVKMYNQDNKIKLEELHVKLQNFFQTNPGKY